MKRKYKNNEEAVSPVIATILMVAITVVLAAVLYVMVIGMGDTGTIETPLGLNAAGRTTDTFTILVSNAPDGAMVDGTVFSYTHNNAVAAISTATVYSSAGVQVAFLNVTAGSDWTYIGTDANTLEFDAGMKITIYAIVGVSSGDTLTISSTEAYFGTTQYNI